MSATLPIKDRDKVKKMLNYLRGKSPRDALLFQVGINTSLRISDLLRLQVHHVANPDGSIKEYIDIKEKKTGKPNRIKIVSKPTENTPIPLSVVLKAYITRYSLKPHYYLFFRTKFSRGQCDNKESMPITRDWASKVLCRAAKACKIGHFNTQSMRKTHAYHIYMVTKKNIALVQTMLGHLQPSTTLRYIGVTQDEVDDGRELVSF